MKIYPRKVIPQIEKYLKIPEIIVIHGARQTGKTTVLNILAETLKKKMLPSNIIYFDLEDFELVNLCNNSVKAVVEHLKAIGCDFKRRIVLFIDEIQYLENPASFLKYFFDHFKNKIKLIVSGSSTFAIKSKFKESLVGRTVNFELFGLDFNEFLTFKNLNYDLQTIDKIAVQELKKLFSEFIFYGSYPRVVLEDSKEIKEHLIKQIINTYLRKDIKDLAHIADINKFNNLLRILADQSGSLLNSLELANTVDLSRPTVENYLMILENTYIIKIVRPFYQNVRKELTKMPKLYFEDLGLKNILETGEFPRIMRGADLEGAVFSLLRKNYEAENIHFWRTVQKEEIDFVVRKKSRIVAYEVKLNVRAKDRLILKKFRKLYPGAKIYLVGFNLSEEDASDREIHFLYPWQVV